MFLQDGKARRKPLVYGKLKRSTSAYNVFDLEDVLGGGTQSRSSSKQVDIERGQQPIHGQVVKPIERTPPRKLANARQCLKPEQKPLDSDVITQKEYAVKDQTGPRTSAFDLLLSDEEDSTIPFQNSMQKRRRLTPVGSRSSTVNSYERSSTWSGTNKESNQHSQKIRTRTTLQYNEKTASESRSVQQSLSRTKTPDREEDDLSLQVAHHKTPKQRRLLSNVINSPVPMDSPSKLPFPSLTLLGGRHSDSEAPEPSIKPVIRNKAIVQGLSKPRTRLIDAMVSPLKRSSVLLSPELSPEGSVLDTPAFGCETKHAENQVQLVRVASIKDVNKSGEMGDSIQTDASTPLNTSSRPRATYSRERSHLADMVVEDLLEPVIHSASEKDSLLVSRNGPSLSSFDSLHSQRASEDELEQEVAGIRSIHELRRAGGNARSQVDLESILEDIEARDPPARARRVGGLAQLIGKLDNDDVRRHILDQSLDRRFSRWPHLEGDIVGQTLLAMLLSRLMTSEQLTATSLKEIFRTVVFSGMALLQEPREFTLIVRDRKQNLSKAVGKEITALVEPCCASHVWQGRHPKAPSPRLIYVKFLDIILRQLRQLGDFEMVLPASIFSQLIWLLLDTAPTDLVDAKVQDRALVLESIVSVIESLTISRNWPDDGCLEIAKKLSGLGPILGQLTLSSPYSSDRTHHLILRLILNITNNDSALCDAFSEKALICAIFGIVKRDFLQTPMLANAVLDETKMEGVILALGALSNLAEHSNVFRRATLDTSLDGRSMVDWITVTFRDQVQVASEVCFLPVTGC